jgi:DNA-binding transcriptional regulator/RsmH inhibitor MraZ
MTDVARVVGDHRWNRVATYRAYRLDRAGRLTRAAKVFEATDDDTAIVRARALMGDADDLEIWEGSRLVGPTRVSEDIREQP